MCRQTLLMRGRIACVDHGFLAVIQPLSLAKVLATRSRKSKWGSVGRSTGKYSPALGQVYQIPITTIRNSLHQNKGKASVRAASYHLPGRGPSTGSIWIPDEGRASCVRGIRCGVGLTQG